MRNNCRTMISTYTRLFFAALFLLVEDCRLLHTPDQELTSNSTSGTSVQQDVVMG